LGPVLATPSESSLATLSATPSVTPSATPRSLLRPQVQSSSIQERNRHTRCTHPGSGTCRTDSGRSSSEPRSLQSSRPRNSCTPRPSWHGTCPRRSPCTTRPRQPRSGRSRMLGRRPRCRCRCTCRGRSSRRGQCRRGTCQGRRQLWVRRSEPWSAVLLALRLGLPWESELVKALVPPSESWSAWRLASESGRQSAVRWGEPWSGSGKARRSAARLAKESVSLTVIVMAAGMERPWAEPSVRWWERELGERSGLALANVWVRQSAAAWAERSDRPWGCWSGLPTEMASARQWASRRGPRSAQRSAQR